MYNFIRFPGPVYHFSLLICYPCSFYFHALMLLSHWQCKLPPLNDIGKDEKLTTEFQKVMTFSLARGLDWALSLSLARGFDLVLSLGVTTRLIITPVVGISVPCILGKECFDMLKSVEFGDLVRLFPSSRRSDRVYLGWFMWESVWGLFRMQVSRRSVKAD